MPVSKYSESIARIEKYLVGNGQKGLLDRMTIIEEQTKSLGKTVESLAQSIKEVSESSASLSKSVEALKDMLEKHCGTPHLYALMQKKLFWGGMILAVILINILTNYAPMALNALLSVLGIPFQLPIL